MIRVVTLVVSRISTGGVRWFEPVVSTSATPSQKSGLVLADSASPQAVVTGSTLFTHTPVNTAAMIRVVTLVVSRIPTGGVRWFEPVVSTSASSVTEVWVGTR